MKDGAQFKTNGSWAYTRRTLSCDNPMDPPTTEIPSLVVLATEQVVAHISGEVVLKIAPLHENLIHSMGTKRKEDKEKGEGSPTPTQPKGQEKRTRPNGENWRH